MHHMRGLREKKTLLKCWISVKNVPAILLHFLKPLIPLNIEIINNSKFSFFSVGSSKAFSL